MIHVETLTISNEQKLCIPVYFGPNSYFCSTKSKTTIVMSNLPISSSFVAYLYSLKNSCPDQKQFFSKITPETIVTYDAANLKSKYF